MKTKRLFVACVLSMASLSPIATQAGVQIDVDVAPPAPQVEEVPAARPGYVWAPGYWNWNHGRHAWTRGHWIRERPGSHWVPDAWEQRGPKYHYEPGHWERG